MLQMGTEDVNKRQVLKNSTSLDSVVGLQTSWKPSIVLSECLKQRQMLQMGTEDVNKTQVLKNSTSFNLVVGLWIVPVIISKTTRTTRNYENSHRFEVQNKRPVKLQKGAVLSIVKNLKTRKVDKIFSKSDMTSHFNVMQSQQLINCLLDIFALVIKQQKCFWEIFFMTEFFRCGTSFA